MRRRRKLLVFAIAAVLVVIGLFVLKPGFRTRPDFLNGANTVGYSNLIAIAKKSESLGRDSELIETLKRALREPVEAPDRAYHASEIPLDDHIAIKVLARALVAKGAEAEKRGDNKTAADYYVSAFRVGISYEHGPLIYFLVGAAIERFALAPLKKLIPKLSTDEISAIARQLQAVNRDRISFTEIVRREEYYADSNATNIMQYVRARFSSQSRKVVKNSTKIHLNLQTEFEGIAAAAAIIAYNRENKSPLVSFQTLVPKYLESIPLDPHCACPMRLLATSGGAVAYSVGQNKRDESGRGDDIAFSFVDQQNVSK